MPLSSAQKECLSALAGGDLKKLSRALSQCESQWITTHALGRVVSKSNWEMVGVVLPWCVFTKKTGEDFLNELASLGQHTLLDKTLQHMVNTGIDPQKWSSTALEMAIIYGHPLCLNALAPYYTHHRHATEALALAVANDLPEGVDLFWPNAKWQQLYEAFNKDIALGIVRQADFSPAEERFYAKAQHALISAHLSSSSSPTTASQTSRKM